MNVTWTLKPSSSALDWIQVQEGQTVVVGRVQLGNDKRISRQQMRLQAQGHRLIVTVVGRGITHVRKDAKLFKMLPGKTYYVLPGQVVGIYNVSLTVCRTEIVSDASSSLLTSSVRRLALMFPEADASRLEAAAKTALRSGAGQTTTLQNLVRATAKQLRLAAQEEKAKQMAAMELAQAAVDDLESIEREIVDISGPDVEEERATLPEPPEQSENRVCKTEDGVWETTKPEQDTVTSTIVEDASPPECMMDSAELVERDFQTLQSIFPDCEEPYLEQLVRDSAPQNRVKVIARRFLEEGYPKETPLERRARVRAMAASQVEEKKEKISPVPPFPKKERPVTSETPEKTQPTEQLERRHDYRDTSWVTSELYRDCVVNELANRFPLLPLRTVKKALAASQHHFTPALEMLVKWTTAGRVKMNKKERLPLKQSRRDPILADEILAWEDEESNKLAERLLKEEHEERGVMVECGHCSGHVSVEDTISCTGGHVFCKACARHSGNALLEQGMCRLTCLEESCSKAYTEMEVEQFLDRKMLEFYQQQTRRGDFHTKTTEAIAIEECPFCEFVKIWEGSTETIFRCQNPRCMKESCVLCKQPNHSPLRCKENLLTRPEQQVSSRACPDCNNTVWTITAGINTCSCGASCCHDCNQQISALYRSAVMDYKGAVEELELDLVPVKYPSYRIVKVGAKRTTATAGFVRVVRKRS